MTSPVMSASRRRHSSPALDAVVAACLVLSLAACNTSKPATPGGGKSPTDETAESNESETMKPSADAEATAREFLGPDLHRLEDQEIPVEGWTFFEASIKGDRDGPQFVVVRNGDTIVKADREAELAKILAELKGADGVTPEQMARAAMMVLQPGGQKLLRQKDLDRLAKTFDVAPEIKPAAYDDDAKTLTFWLAETGRSTNTAGYTVGRVGSEELTIERKVLTMKRIQQ